MLLDIEVFGTVSNGYHEALSTAFDDFTTWRKSMKLSSSQRRFTPGMLLRPATYGFYLNAKGHNSRIVCEWLLRKLIHANASPQFQDKDERLKLCEVALTLNMQKKCTCYTCSVHIHVFDTQAN